MPKRKRVVLNFQQKLEILRQLSEGIGTSTISDIKRNGDAILEFVSNLESEDQISEKKTRRTAQNTYLDSSIHKWYVEEKKKGVPPPDAAVCAKALEINKQLTNSDQNFKASIGWLRHFKNRHGIKDRESKKENEEEESCVNVGRQIKNMIKRKGYTLENVYNADDGFLLWKTLPDCNNKDQSIVTVVACCNANASHKLPLCVIARNKNVTEKYKLETNDQIIFKIQDPNETNNFFEDWFEDVFIPHVKNRQEIIGNGGKILLVIDDASWHPPRDTLIKDRDDIDVLIIPATSSVQAMELEIKQFKITYRRKLLELLLSKSPRPIKQFLEEFTLSESISVISEAWDSIPRTHILQSWGTLLSDSKNGTGSGHDGISEIVAIAQRIAGLDHCNFDDVMRWLDCDKDDLWINGAEEDADFPEESRGIETKVEPSSIDAYQSMETVIEWFIRQEEFNSAQMSTLESVRDLIASKICGNIKQEMD